MRNIYYFFRGFLAYIKFLTRCKRNNYSILHYRDLWEVSFFSKKKFLQLKTSIVNFNIDRIKNKGNCKVGFVVHSVSMWTVDGLYQLMKNSNNYKPIILVVPYATSEVNKETKNYFQNKGYEVETLNTSSFDINSFDVIVYTHPYVADENNINILSLSLDKLVSYVSYSYILSNKIEKLDMPVYLLSWKFFCDSPFYKELVEKKSRIYSNNAVFCGYPKMDRFFSSLGNSIDMIGDKKVIIYGPHQSVNYTGIKSATFELNGWYMLYLAEKLKDKVFWIVKPHPLLRIHSVEAGLFNDEKGYDDYLNKWQQTGSAKVIENGDYMEAFKSSSAMITDSVSFLAEYQFTGKPLLLLESGKQTYNEFGNSIKEILYKCKGNDFFEIEAFINNVLLSKDNMKEVRKKFFNTHLACINGSGKLACDNIFSIFNTEII